MRAGKGEAAVYMAVTQTLRRNWKDPMAYAILTGNGSYLDAKNNLTTGKIPLMEMIKNLWNKHLTSRTNSVSNDVNNVPPMGTPQQILQHQRKNSLWIKLHGCQPLTTESPTIEDMMDHFQFENTTERYHLPIHDEDFDRCGFDDTRKNKAREAHYIICPHNIYACLLLVKDVNLLKVFHIDTRIKFYLSGDGSKPALYNIGFSYPDLNQSISEISVAFVPLMHLVAPSENGPVVSMGIYLLCKVMRLMFDLSIPMDGFVADGSHALSNGIQDSVDTQKRLYDLNDLEPKICTCSTHIKNAVLSNQNWVKKLNYKRNQRKIRQNIISLCEARTVRLFSMALRVMTLDWENKLEEARLAEHF